MQGSECDTTQRDGSDSTQRDAAMKRKRFHATGNDAIKWKRCNATRHDTTRHNEGKVMQRNRHDAMNLLLFNFT
jgi:Tfp pilus assembly major pilin PilA